MRKILISVFFIVQFLSMSPSKAWAASEVRGDSHANWIEAFYDSSDSKRLFDIFGPRAIAVSGNHVMYWETAPTPHARIFCQTQKSCYLEVQGYMNPDPQGPRSTQWHFEWKGPFLATSEFMDGVSSNEASRLYNLMSDDSLPGYEVREFQADGCQIKSKKFLADDGKSMFACQRQTCSAEKTNYCVFSVASKKDQLADLPKGPVTGLRPPVAGGRSPLKIPAFQVFRSTKLGLEFTNLIGEGQWVEANRLCAKRDGGWRLPTKEEIEALSAGEIIPIPEEIFGKKYAGYVASYRGGPLYHNIQAKFSHINVVFDELAAVMCVRRVP
jgi:hypothetical protein